ncbi:enoyl-CoA-hydratase DpgB [Streptomyces cinnamoneus]
MIRIDGTRPPSAGLVAAVTAACERVEDRGTPTRVVVEASGAPDGEWTRGLTPGLVGKWERALRRLERLPAATVAVATGDCGGTALDALLAADHRVVSPDTRLVLPVAAGAPWPGMALYRLVREGGGTGAVRRAILFGAPLEAADALALHLVHAVSDDLPGALEAADGLAGRVPGAELAIRRQLMLDASSVGFEEALGAHLAACDRALRQTDAGTAP